MVPLWQNIIFVCYHHHYTIVASEIVSDWTYVYVAHIRINLYLNCRDILPEVFFYCFSTQKVDDDIEDEHDYSRIVLPGASDDEDDDEDIYKVPRNVVSHDAASLPSHAHTHTPSSPV